MRKAACLILIAALALPFMASAEEEGEKESVKTFYADGYEYWVAEDGKATIVKLLDPYTRIPSEKDGYPVTGIDANAFSGKDCGPGIRFPETMRVVGESAFADCLLLFEVLLNDSLAEIGAYAFAGTGLEEVEIPKGVRLIGRGAFNRCEDLEKISVSAENAAYADIDGVLFEKAGRMLHSYPKAKHGWSYQIPQGIRAVGPLAFSGCGVGSGKLKEIKIPDSVTQIGEEAFIWCSKLEQLDIPDSVTDIGAEAFSNCGDMKLIVGSGSYAMDYAVKNGLPYTLR